MGDLDEPFVPLDQDADVSVDTSSILQGGRRRKPPARLGAYTDSVDADDSDSDSDSEIEVINDDSDNYLPSPTKTPAQTKVVPVQTQVVVQPTRPIKSITREQAKEAADARKPVAAPTPQAQVPLKRNPAIEALAQMFEHIGNAQELQKLTRSAEVKKALQDQTVGQLQEEKIITLAQKLQNTNLPTLQQYKQGLSQFDTLNKTNLKKDPEALAQRIRDQTSRYAAINQAYKDTTAQQNKELHQPLKMTKDGLTKTFNTSLNTDALMKSTVWSSKPNDEVARDMRGYTNMKCVMLRAARDTDVLLGDPATEITEREYRNCVGVRLRMPSVVGGGDTYYGEFVYADYVEPEHGGLVNRYETATRSRQGVKFSKQSAEDKKNTATVVRRMVTWHVHDQLRVKEVKEALKQLLVQQQAKLDQLSKQLPAACRKMAIDHVEINRKRAEGHVKQQVADSLETDSQFVLDTATLTKPDLSIEAVTMNNHRKLKAQELRQLASIDLQAAYMMEQDLINPAFNVDLQYQMAVTEYTTASAKADFLLKARGKAAKDKQAEDIAAEQEIDNFRVTEQRLRQARAKVELATAGEAHYQKLFEKTAYDLLNTSSDKDDTAALKTQEAIGKATPNQRAVNYVRYVKDNKLIVQPELAELSNNAVNIAKTLAQARQDLKTVMGDFETDEANAIRHLISATQTLNTVSAMRMSLPTFELDFENVKQFYKEEGTSGSKKLFDVASFTVGDETYYMPIRTADEVAVPQIKNIGTRLTKKVMGVNTDGTDFSVECEAKNVQKIVSQDISNSIAVQVRIPVYANAKLNGEPTVQSFEFQPSRTEPYRDDKAAEFWKAQMIRTIDDGIVEQINRELAEGQLGDVITESGALLTKIQENTKRATSYECSGAPHLKLLAYTSIPVQTKETKEIYEQVRHYQRIADELSKVEADDLYARKFDPKAPEKFAQAQGGHLGDFQDLMSHEFENMSRSVMKTMNNEAGNFNIGTMSNLVYQLKRKAKQNVNANYLTRTATAAAVGAGAATMAGAGIGGTAAAGVAAAAASAAAENSGTDSESVARAANTINDALDCVLGTKRDDAVMDPSALFGNMFPNSVAKALREKDTPSDPCWKDDNLAAGGGYEGQPEGDGKRAFNMMATTTRQTDKCIKVPVNKHGQLKYHKNVSDVAKMLSYYCVASKGQADILRGPKGIAKEQGEAAAQEDIEGKGWLKQFKEKNMFRAISFPMFIPSGPSCVRAKATEPGPDCVPEAITEEPRESLDCTAGSAKASQGLLLGGTVGAGITGTLAYLTTTGLASTAASTAASVASASAVGGGLAAGAAAVTAAGGGVALAAGASVASLLVTGEAGKRAVQSAAYGGLAGAAVFGAIGAAQSKPCALRYACADIL